MTDLRYMIADAQHLFAEGFKQMLTTSAEFNSECVGIAHSGEELIQLIEENEAEILFTDLSFNDIDGIELIKKVKKIKRSIRIVVLTSYTDHKLVKTAFQNGVDAYYSKFNPFKEMDTCLSNVLSGETFLSEGLYITPPQRQKREIVNGAAKRLEDRFMIKQKLTRREHEVLSLITKAMNNKEIAKELFISDQTVGVHRKNIMRKLGVRNTVNLIKFAIENQLV